MATDSKKNFLYMVLCGILLGISIIAPGISGSVIAVMMGIYQDLIGIISNPFKNLKKNIVYFLPLGIGTLIAMLLFLQLFNLLFEHFRIPGYFLFISLIAGSLPSVFKEAGGRKAVKKRYITGALFALALALTVGITARYNLIAAVDTTSAAGASETLYLSLCGFIAGVTSMVPGMSVSMMLMMLNAYEPLLKAASGFDIVTVAPVGICFVIGMFLFSNLTKLVFKKYSSLAYFMVLGFMSGSIINIFPGLPADLLNIVLSIVAILIGLCASYYLITLSKKVNIPKDAQKAISE